MTLAFLVEGGMEQRIVQRLCPGKPVRLIELNGRDASLAAIAKRIGTLFRLLGNRYYPVVIILDREDRELSVDDMERDLRVLLVGESVPCDQIIFGIPDRMIENWILADPSCWNGAEGDGNFEGANGKSRLRDNLEAQGRTYSEIADGVSMFCEINCQIAVRNSVSFQNFNDRLSHLCRWMR